MRARTGSTRITAPRAVSVSSIIRLRLTRSTSVPSNKPKSRYGTNSDAVVMARFVAERVRSKTSKGSAKRVKELPTCETSWPVKYSQKSRPRDFVGRSDEVTRSMLPSQLDHAAQRGHRVCALPERR